MKTHSSVLAWRIPMDGGAWWATVDRVTELDMTEQVQKKKKHIGYCKDTFPQVMAGVYKAGDLISVDQVISD